MAAPVNTVLPAITGTVEFGEILTLSDGAWDVVPDSYAYAWLRAGTPITGATTATYTITRADIGYTLVGRVTATNVDGGTDADSAATVAVPSTLIVEDGTEVANADAYATLVYIADYHDKNGNAAWAAIANDATRETYVRRATAYMLQAYRQRWKGYRRTSTQSLCWPRSFVYLEPFVHGAVGAYPYLVSDIIVPVEVKNACAEYALKAITETSLMPDATQNVKKEIVGPITIEYDAYSAQAVRYSSVDAMLSPYLNSSGISVQLVK